MHKYRGGEGSGALGHQNRPKRDFWGKVGSKSVCSKKPEWLDLDIRQGGLEGEERNLSFNGKSPSARVMKKDKSRKRLPMKHQKQEYGRFGSGKTS